MKSFNAGILGATGAVGQKFIRLLRNHPWFTITSLGASAKSAGKPYREATHWIEDIELPESVGSIKISECDPENFSTVDFVFSGLDASVATEIERKFAEAGIPVISNAKNYRMHEDVPLLIPEVNPGHIQMIERQKFSENGKGWIVTNPNCVSIPLATSLQPFHERFGIKSVIVTSLQSVSGAGYPGVASMDILGNVVPHIGGEEDKIQTESLKLLGTIDPELKSIEFAEFNIEATAVRVATLEGHLLSVTLELHDKPGSLDEVTDAINNWKSPIEELGLPSSPEKPIKLYTNPSFPQPRLHSWRENGMQTAIGRLRTAEVLDISYVTLAHNTIRGAAGGAILNAELLVEKGYLS